MTPMPLYIHESNSNYGPNCLLYSESRFSPSHEGCFAFDRCLNTGRISLKEQLLSGLDNLTQNRRILFVTLLIWVNVIIQFIPLKNVPF